MRIVFLTTGYLPTLGGQEIHGHQVASELVNRGHEVHVVSSGWHAPLGSLRHYRQPRVVSAELEFDGVTVHHLRLLHGVYMLLPRLYKWPVPMRANLRRWMRPRAFADFDRRARALVHRLRPEVLLSMSWTNPIPDALRRSESGCPWPLVVLPLRHVGDPNEETERVRRDVQNATAVIADTTFEGEGYHDDFEVPTAKIFPISPGRPPLSEPGAYPRAPRVMYLGRLTLNKGLGRLLAAMARVWKRLPEARLVLVGARTAETAAVDVLLAALPPEAAVRVERHEHDDDAAKRERLRQTACLVLPSLYESFGMVLMEAWSEGTPVITYDLPVFRCTVSHGDDGLLVAPAEEGVLVEAILEILNDPERAEAMGRAGRQKAESWRTWPEVAAAYEAVLQQAARDFAGPRTPSS